MKHVPLLSCTVCVLFLSTAAFPLGYRLYDQSADAMGQASAVTASIEGPSSIFYNPAALVRPSGEASETEHAFSAGFTYLMPQFDYTGPTGVTESARKKYYMLPELYYAYTPAETPFAFGIGLFSPFGIGTHWRGSSSLRYSSTSTELLTADINPTFAWRLSDSFSIGVGLNYIDSEATLENKLDYGLLMGAPGMFDADAKVEGDGEGYGWNLGLLYEINENNRLGLLYRSHINIDMDATTTISNIPAALGIGPMIRSDAAATIELPAYARLGYAYDVNDRLTLEFDIDWTNWGTVNDLAIKNDVAVLGTTVIPMRYKDSFVYAVGATYAATDCLDLKCGYVYVETPIKEEFFMPMLPDANRHAFHLGTSYTLNWLTIHVAYQYLIFEDRSVTNSVGAPAYTVNGDYEASSHALSAAVDIEF